MDTLEGQGKGVNHKLRVGSTEFEMSLRHPSADILLAVGDRGAECEEGRTRDINKDVVDVQVVM